MRETQKSITEWGDEHYPDESLEQLFHNLVEEVAELGATLGVAHADAARTLAISYEKSAGEFADRSKTASEIGDVDISLKFLASHAGIDVAEATDAKMAKNRLRSVADSAMRKARKKALGLRQA